MARPSVTVEIKGLKELKARMDKLSKDLAQDTAKRAVSAGASIVKKKAKANVRHIAEEPYIASGGEKDRSTDKVIAQPGNVPNNIIMKRRKFTKLSAEYVVTVRGKKKHGYASRIASLIEFGTVKQSPAPFLAPALSQNLPEISAAMKRRIALRLKRLGAQ